MTPIAHAVVEPISYIPLNKLQLRSIQKPLGCWLTTWMVVTNLEFMGNILVGMRILKG